LAPALEPLRWRDREPSPQGLIEEEGKEEKTQWKVEEREREKEKVCVYVCGGDKRMGK
jgi:hypothetical protein